MTKICAFCGEEFDSSRSDQKFCCRKCKEKQRLTREDVKEKNRLKSLQWYQDNKEYALQRITQYNQNTQKYIVNHLQKIFRNS